MRTLVLWVMAAWALIYLIPLGVRPMVSPDEPRYGAIPAEMVRSGDLMHMRIAGFRYYEKPPLGYWMTAASIGAFGANPFSVRLPMAVSALLAAGAVAMLLKGSVPSRPALAPLAALCLLTMLGMSIGGTFAILDVPFAALVTLSIACFFLAARCGWGMWGLVSAGAACACALLTKGLLAIVIPALAIGPWLAWERRWRELLILPPATILAALIIVAGPAIALHRHEPEFWHSFIWIEHFRRFAGGDANQHVAPWWYYLAVLPAAIVPWLFSARAALSGLRRSGSESVASGPRLPSDAHAARASLARLCVCWIVVPLVFLSLSSGKLAPYLLPMLPPVAILLVLGLSARLTRPTALAHVNHIPGFVLIAVGVLTTAVAFTPLSTLLWLTGGTAKLLLLGAALMTWGVADWWAQASSDASVRILRMGLSPVAFLAVLPTLLPTALMPGWKIPQEEMRALAPVIRSASAVVTEESLAHALSFWTGRDDCLIVGSPGELDNELGDPSETARFVDAESVARLIGSNHPGGVILILRSGMSASIHLRLDVPTPIEVVHFRGWSMLRFGEGSEAPR